MAEQTRLDGLVSDAGAAARPRGRPAGARRLRGARARAAPQAQRRALAAALGRRRQRQPPRRSAGRTPRRSTRSAATGSAVFVTGVFEISERWGAKIKLAELREAEPHEYEPGRAGARVRRLAGAPGGATCGRCWRRSRNRSCGSCSTASSPRAREAWARFRDAPAAKVYHQAYRHGLLEHTLSVAQAVSAAANFFPGIDRDVAVTGALLHDIGKTEAYNDDPLAIDLTDLGRLQGEIPLGYYLVRRQIEEIPGFDPDLAQCVLHIILSHHGQLEHGSPVVPATREAVLVHMIDNLGGRLGSFDRLERQLPAGEAWSGFDRALSGSAYFGQRAA